MCGLLEHNQVDQNVWLSVMRALNKSAKFTYWKVAISPFVINKCLLWGRNFMIFELYLNIPSKTSFGICQWRLPIMNTATLNGTVHGFLNFGSVSSVPVPRSGIARSQGEYMRNCFQSWTPLQSEVPVCTPTSNEEGACLPTVLPIEGVVILFNFHQSDK